MIRTAAATERAFAFPTSIPVPHTNYQLQNNINQFTFKVNMKRVNQNEKKDPHWTHLNIVSAGDTA